MTIFYSGVTCGTVKVLKYWANVNSVNSVKALNDIDTNQILQNLSSYQ